MMAAGSLLPSPRGWVQTPAGRLPAFARPRQTTPREGRANGSCGYWTVRARLVELLIAVTPLLDWAVTATLYVPAGVAWLGGGP